MRAVADDEIGARIDECMRQFHLPIGKPQVIRDMARAIYEAAKAGELR